MFSIGFLEIIVIAIVALVVLGPQRLPWLMKQCAFFYRQFVQVKNEFNYQMHQIDDEEQKKRQVLVINQNEEAKKEKVE